MVHPGDDRLDLLAADRVGLLAGGIHRQAAAM
jgi:hypothetical protein